MTAPAIRPARPDDIPRMAELLLSGAQQRELLDRALWAAPPDARSAIEAAVRADLDRAGHAPQTLWLLAETSGRIVALAHAMVVPVPPVYDVGAAPPGLLLDDCVVAQDAPTGTAAALLAAAEAALRSAGAGAMIAACAAASPLRAVYEQHGYQPVTLYLGKHGFQARGRPADVRSALPEDAPAISRLGARHRQTLAELNPLFWRLHAEADRRWERFVRYMMTLGDRAVLVADGGGSLQGYAVAQPISPLLVPAGHDIARVGVIDDFYALDFAEPEAMAADNGAAARLLASAESWFAGHGFAAALVVCPAAWTSKVRLLEREGYRTAKLWMFKP